MPGGRIFALLFFVSVFFAGITSLMNMLEACGEALTSTFRLSRTVSTLLVGAAAFLPGLFLESLAGMRQLVASPSSAAHGPVAG